MDREKVIKGLEDSFANQGYGYMDGVGELYAVSGEDLQNAIALLKEQEAVTVESIQMDRSDKWGADLTGYCPSCKRPLKSRFNQRFCGECRQAVKWNE